jgi:N2-acetyl-L-2,4-diaminobutanoate deacetylase
MPAVVVHDPSEIDFSRAGKHHYQVAFHLDSTWGYSLVPLTVINGLREGRGDAPPGVAAFGGNHGNEWEGQVAIKRLSQDLDPAEMRGRVILVPQLNPGACDANQRVSALDGVNMNRAFPGDPAGTITYRIAHFVKTRIFPQVRVVVDIHSGGNEGAFAPCTSFHPIADAAQRTEIATVAKLFDTPFIMIYAGAMAPGLLPSEAENDGKIAVGSELGYAEGVNPKGVRHAYEGIRNVLRYCGILPGAVVKIDQERMTPPRFVSAANLADYIPCPRTGIWEPVVTLGDEVRQGDLLGRLHDFGDHASPALEILAHCAGVVMMMHFPARAEKGVTLYVIAEPVAEF